MSPTILLAVAAIIIAIELLFILRLRAKIKAKDLELDTVRKHMLRGMNALTVALGLDEELVEEELRHNRPVDINTMARLIQGKETFELTEEDTSSNEPAPETEPQP